MSKENQISPTPVSVSANPERLASLKHWLFENEIPISDRVLNDDERLSHHALALYPDVPGGCLASQVGSFGAGSNSLDSVYVLGDTHGDFESCVSIFDSILKMTDTPTVYLLGDVIDRNKESCMLECVFLLAILQKKFPEEFEKYNSIRLGIIKGDHDIGLQYNEPYSPEKRFTALVSPADYCDWLNEGLDSECGEEATKVGRAWIRLMKHCPAAAFLESSGTLLSHGGVPRKDIQEKLQQGEPYLIQSERSATDFEWCRMVQAKNKMLNRSSKTSEIGGQEFDSFCKTVFPDIRGDAQHPTKIHRFIFGHQHPAKGVEFYTKFYDGYEAVCLASFRADDILGGPTIPHFAKITVQEVDGKIIDDALSLFYLKEEAKMEKVSFIDKIKDFFTCLFPEIHLAIRSIKDTSDLNPNMITVILPSSVLFPQSIQNGSGEGASTLENNETQKEVISDQEVDAEIAPIPKDENISDDQSEVLRKPFSENGQQEESGLVSVPSVNGQQPVADSEQTSASLQNGQEATSEQVSAPLMSEQQPVAESESASTSLQNGQQEESGLAPVSPVNEQQPVVESEPASTSLQNGQEATSEQVSTSSPEISDTRKIEKSLPPENKDPQDILCRGKEPSEQLLSFDQISKQACSTSFFSESAEEERTEESNLQTEDGINQPKKLVPPPIPRFASLQSREYNPPPPLSGIEDCKKPERN